RHAGDVAAEGGIVFQRLPGQWIVVVADAEKSTEGEHGVRHPAALLVDHHALDRADLVLIGAIDRSSLDLVAADQVTGFVCFQGHRFPPVGFEGRKTKGVRKRSERRGRALTQRDACEEKFLSYVLYRAPPASNGKGRIEGE